MEMVRNEVHVEEMLRDLIPNFMNSRQVELEEIHRIIQSKDFDALAKIGHRLKGTSLNYGFNDLGKIALQLEIAGKEKNITAAESLLFEIRNYLENVSIVYVNDEP